LIIGRRFNDWLSVQAHASFAHFNQTRAGVDHDRVGLGFNGRVKFSPQSSILFQYDTPLMIKSLSEHRDDERLDPAKPNLGVGWEIRTSTHVFHIYVSSAKGLIPQENYVYNTYDFADGGMMFGFSMIRLWNF
jgi:hypothetical protein